MIKDQEDAGLDILTDGQMWFDDYAMGIGSFLWYWLERTGGFGKQKLAHPARAKAKGREVWALDEAGGVAVEGPNERGPVRLAALYRWAQGHTARPIKACVGAGPVQLSTLAHFRSGPVKDRYDLSRALADVFAAEIHELIEAGCRHVQLEDLGAWMPYLSGDQDWAWVNEIVDRTMRGIDRAQVRTSWHFCMGNAWGNKLEGMTSGGYREIMPHYHGVKIDAYVLDFACREMADADLLRKLPSDKKAHVGVIDVRTLEIEHPEQVAERIRTVLAHIEAERVRGQVTNVTPNAAEAEDVLVKLDTDALLASMRLVRVPPDEEAWHCEHVLMLHDVAMHDGRGTQRCDQACGGHARDHFVLHFGSSQSAGGR